MSTTTADLVGAEREQQGPTHAGATEEVLSIALTSLAAVATAWSAFQSSTWSGVQTFELARATKLRTESTEAHLEGYQHINLDANLFVAFAEAYASGKQDFAAFLLQRFPPRLRVATEAWMATRPLKNPDAPPHPLAMREYKVEALERAGELGRQADDATRLGANANRTSDIYVLGTVVFATIILLASLGAKLHSKRTRHVMLVLSALALAGAIAWLLVRPVAWAGVHV